MKVERLAEEKFEETQVKVSGLEFKIELMGKKDGTMANTAG